MATTRLKPTPCANNPNPLLLNGELPRSYLNAQHEAMNKVSLLIFHNQFRKNQDLEFREIAPA